jgi:hypothetical protein
VHCYLVFDRVVCAFSALLRAQLVALLPVKFILLYAVVGQSVRVNEAVNRVVRVVGEHLWTPQNAW